MLQEILRQYDIPPEAIVKAFGSGLINHTWQITTGPKTYILQKINTQVFKRPEDIAGNIETIADYLSKAQPVYQFVTPVKTVSGNSLVCIEGKDYYRLFPFVNGSHTNDVAETPEQAFEAAHQFGLFTKVLRSLPVNTLKITLPDFHNLLLRYDQFQHACMYGNSGRITEAQEEISFLQNQDHIVSTYKQIISSPAFKLRVTHHDTKISNVLFDANDRGICVIDLDTVMPGYFISDVGDMMRTYLSPVSEEEKDLNKIEIRDEYFKAILNGYLTAMGDELGAEETWYFVYAGMFMIYMQAIRFLTDHLNDDVYYGAAYSGHNYVRAQNQVILLKQLMAKENQLKKMVAEAATKHVKLPLT